jgi:putative DNA primase/helicase
MERKGLTELLNLAAQGIRVFPIHGINEDGYCTCTNGKDCPSAGKHPRTRGWEEQASDDPEKIQNWWESYPQANWAAKTGTDSALLVVDIDPKNGGDQTWAKLLQNHKLNDAGMIVTTTGSGGTHYWFKRYGKDIRSRPFADGIDIKGEQGLIVIPPSRHYSGDHYTWQPGHDPVNASKKSMPKWLKELIEKNMDASAQYGSMSEGWEAGSRNDKLYHHAYIMLTNGADPAIVRAAFDAIMSSEEAFLSDPMEEEEIERIIDNANKKYKRDGATIAHGGALSTNDRNDVGNAAKFTTQHAEDVRFIEDAQVWVSWLKSETIWKMDWNNTYVLGRMIDTAKALAEGAQNMVDKKEAAKLLKWSSDSLNAPRLQSAIKVAQTETSLHVMAEEFNTHTDIVQVNNGLINLRTGELMPVDKEKYITSKIDIDYNPEAECPIWIESLKMSLGDEPGLLEFMQEALGYSLTGETSEQCIFICYGPEGNNGKSTLLEAVQRLMGEMAIMSEFDVIATKKSDNFARAEIAKLVGTRFVSMNEAKSIPLDESLVKQLTGGDTITGRHLFKKSIKFLPQFKIWLRANDRPEIRGIDDAIWRRIRIIPFTKQIPKELRKDRHVIDRELDDEAEGIFTWLVEGAKRWFETGLSEPDAVLLHTAEYRSESDVWQRFLDASAEKIPGSRTPQSDMYNYYKDWARRNGVPQVSSIVFNATLKRKGVEEGASRDTLFWLDYTVRDEVLETSMDYGFR